MTSGHLANRVSRTKQTDTQGRALVIDDKSRDIGLLYLSDVNDFRTLNNPGFWQPVGASKN